MYVWLLPRLLGKADCSHMQSIPYMYMYVYMYLWLLPRTAPTCRAYHVGYHSYPSYRVTTWGGEREVRLRQRRSRGAALQHQGGVGRRHRRHTHRHGQHVGRHGGAAGTTAPAGGGAHRREGCGLALGLLCTCMHAYAKADEGLERSYMCARSLLGVCYSDRLMTGSCTHVHACSRDHIRTT